MRKTLVALVALIAVAAWFWSSPSKVESVGQTFVFPLSLKGKTNQTDIAFPPGSKDIQGKVNDKAIAGVLQGTLPDFAAQYLHLDGSGRFYLLFDGRDTWRVATNPNGDGATTFRGQTSVQGSFWLAAKVAFPVPGPDADVFAVGKVKFAKGTFNPVKISGTIHFVSKDIGECFTLKFKTGPPLL